MKPIPTRKFRKFLKSLGLVKIRTESSHEIWDRPDDSLIRPVTVDSNYKEIPRLHIQTNLRTLGISNKEFEEMIKRIK